ncbi:MAG: hypothetical protein IJ880_16365 [Bacilli bacterium]|nr:hypothetical protein [Bacilli bacterium]
MITTKTCSSCEHFPNDHHCIGCVWNADKQENTKWELKKNPIVIERAVLDKIRVEIKDWQTDIHDNEYDAEKHDFVFERIYEIIDMYMAEGSEE